MQQATARTGIKKCPICHTENLMEATKCGKCGYVFPDSKALAKAKSKNPFGAVNPADITPNANFGSESPDQQQEQYQEGQEEEPQIPKSMFKEGQKEGPFKLKGQSIKCPRCETEFKWYLSRCPVCGYKNSRAR
jgi:ribosomal protein L40E